MLPLLAPILAQLVTLSVGDRTEARYIAGDNTHFEGATRPLAGLTFGWRRGALTLAYLPSITVIPLERAPREVLVFQNVGLGGSYRWRRTSLSLSQGVGFGQLSFRVQALADPGATPAAVPSPTAPGATPAPGGMQPGGTPTAPGGVTTSGMNPQATNQVRVRKGTYVTSTSTLGVAHTVSRAVVVGAGANYTEAGGVGTSKEQYPVTRGVGATAFGSHTTTVGRRDSFTSSVSTQFSQSSTGNRVWGVLVGEGWGHRLSARTTTRLGVGVSGTRLSQDDGTVAYGVYPTANAGITHFDRLAGGTLTLGATATAAPFLDTLRATVDPRLGVGANAGWGRDRFSMGAGAGAAVSLTGGEGKGAVNSVGASLGMSYRLGAGFSIDDGVSAGWQTFEGTTIIPARS